MIFEKLRWPRRVLGPLNSKLVQCNNNCFIILYRHFHSSKTHKSYFVRFSDNTINERKQIPLFAKNLFLVSAELYQFLPITWMRLLRWALFNLLFDQISYIPKLFPVYCRHYGDLHVSRCQTEEKLICFLQECTGSDFTRALQSRQWRMVIWCCSMGTLRGPNQRCALSRTNVALLQHHQRWGNSISICRKDCDKMVL